MHTHTCTHTRTHTHTHTFIHACTHTHTHTHTCTSYHYLAVTLGIICFFNFIIYTSVVTFQLFNLYFRLTEFNFFMLCPTGNIGMSDVADMMSCTMDAIDKNEFLDAGRVAVVGGSHGGKKVNYVVLCSLCSFTFCFAILYFLTFCHFIVNHITMYHTMCHM